MGYPRKSQISLRQTPYYHCVSRCVRRAWLYGFDDYAGKDYSHRKGWVVDRLKHLSKVFAIDCCAYAVMSNHHHTVLCVDADRAKGWSERTVAARWAKLFKVPPLVKRYLKEEVSAAHQDSARKRIQIWRRRLMDVSWYMRCLNEYLARRANAEDACTGRFWQGRFKSQALLDEAGLLTAMAYVDLNPIRAGIATTPEESEFTSIYQRIQAMRGMHKSGPKLKSFRSQTEPSEASDFPLPCTFNDYLELLDWTGRAVRQGKRGQIDEKLPSILVRLNIDKSAWVEAMRPQGNVFGRAMGKLDHLLLHARALGQQWIKGLRQAERLYGTP